MVRLQTLRGYLLEEVLAWLLRSSGYRLLTEKGDPARPPWKVLEKRHHGLVVRGSRGLASGGHYPARPHPVAV